MENIKLGKKVLDNLIEGMYVDCFFIFREYVQNASDSIDEAVKQGFLTNRREGQIEITLSLDTAIIRDNGMGVSKVNAIEELGYIGASKKDPTIKKGFRGIGRLGGIAYCNKLQFITSAHGEEVKSIITIDCEKLRSEINDDSNDDEAAVIFSRNIHLEHEQEISDKRYFNVCLGDITEKRLLQKDKVVSYLSKVAPVPYNASFSFKKDIKNYLNSKGFEIPEYNIYVENEQIFKLYSDLLYDSGNKNKTVIDSLHSIDFREIKFNNNVIAVLWFGVSKFIKALPLRSNI